MHEFACDMGDGRTRESVQDAVRDDDAPSCAEEAAALAANGMAARDANGAPSSCAEEMPAPVDDELCDRIFGLGERPVDAGCKKEDASNIKATGVAGRAKQFVPFAALRGFTGMVEEVARSHDKIDRQATKKGRR